MTTTMFRSSAILLITAATLGGCATNPHTVAPVGPLRVSYWIALSDENPSSYVLDEVHIVEREQAQKRAAGQVALAVVTFALAGGGAVSGFSKYELRGRPIDGLTDRSNIRNPIPADFVARMQNRVDAWLASSPEFGSKEFRNPLTVGGGSPRLIYESLLDNDEGKFRLVTDLKVSKRAEATGWLQKPPVTVDCRATSDSALTRTEWAADDYVLVKVELDAVLDECERKVIAHLPRLLSR